MELKELYIKGFGKFHNKDISLAPSVNVIYGPNEAGKSTLHDFIRAMLFGMDKGRGRTGKNDPYTRYLPWSSEGDFGGNLVLAGEKGTWRIQRSFRKGSRDFQMVDIQAGLNSSQPEKDLESLLCGLNESLYGNTLSIGQLKSLTDAGMVSELKNHIINLHTSGSLSIDISKASAYLRAEKKSWTAKLFDTTQKDLEDKVKALKDIEEEISKLPSIKHGGLLKQERANLKEKIEALTLKQEEIQPKIEKVKEILNSYDFFKEEDIFFLQNQAEKDYTTYKALEKRASSKKRRILSGLLFGISVLSVICGGVFYFRQNFIPSGSFASLSILTYITGHIISSGRHKAARRVAELKQQLSVIFERFLKSPEVSDESYEAFTAKVSEIKALFPKLRKTEQSSKEQLEELVSLQDRIQKISEALEALQKIEWELERKQETLATLIEEKEIIESCLKENEKIQEEISAIDLSLKTIGDLSTAIHDSFGIYLNKSASEYISALTRGAYDSISIDERLNLFLNTKHRLVPVEQLSKGTIEQVYLALRLAFINFIWPDEPMPLFLDDSFALYDDDRLSSTLSFLYKEYRGQIILFTCHHREKRLLDDMRLSYNYIQM